jgi:hypothetical protein
MYTTRSNVFQRSSTCSANYWRPPNEHGDMIFCQPRLSDSANVRIVALTNQPDRLTWRPQTRSSTRLLRVWSSRRNVQCKILIKTILPFPEFSLVMAQYLGTAVRSVDPIVSLAECFDGPTDFLDSTMSGSQLKTMY